MAMRVEFDAVLGGEPEVKTTERGVTYVKMNAAHHESKRKDDGTWEDVETLWVAVAMFGEKGERAADSLVKGDRVRIIGKARPRAYLTGNDEPRAVLDVVASAVYLAPRVHIPPSKGSARTAPDERDWNGEPPF